MKYVLIIMLFLFLTMVGFSQNLLVDKDLILSDKNQFKETYYDESKGNSSSYIDENKKFINKINPITLPLKVLMYTYQNGVSQQLISGCRFELTCSNFGKESIKEFGFVKGIFLTADRLMRDNMYGLSQQSHLHVNEEGLTIEDVKEYTLK